MCNFETMEKIVADLEANVEFKRWATGNKAEIPVDPDVIRKAVMKVKDFDVYKKNGILGIVNHMAEGKCFTLPERETVEKIIQYSDGVIELSDFYHAIRFNTNWISEWKAGKNLKLFVRWRDLGPLLDKLADGKSLREFKEAYPWFFSMYHDIRYRIKIYLPSFGILDRICHEAGTLSPDDFLRVAYCVKQMKKSGERALTEKEVLDILVEEDKMRKRAPHSPASKKKEIAGTKNIVVKKGKRKIPANAMTWKQYCKSRKVDPEEWEQTLNALIDEDRVHLIRRDAKNTLYLLDRTIELLDERILNSLDSASTAKDTTITASSGKKDAGKEAGKKAENVVGVHCEQKSNDHVDFPERSAEKMSWDHYCITRKLDPDEWAEVRDSVMKDSALFCKDNNNSMYLLPEAQALLDSAILSIMKETDASLKKTERCASQEPTTFKVVISNGNQNGCEMNLTKKELFNQLDFLMSHNVKVSISA